MRYLFWIAVYVIGLFISLVVAAYWPVVGFIMACLPAMRLIFLFAGLQDQERQWLTQKEADAIKAKHREQYFRDHDIERYEQ